MFLCVRSNETFLCLFTFYAIPSIGMIQRPLVVPCLFALMELNFTCILRMLFICTSELGIIYECTLKVFE